MHFAARLLAIAAFGILSSCAGPAVEVNVLSDTPITPGATVAWAALDQNEMQNGDPRIDNDIIRQRIRTGVETALTQRGHQFVSDPSAAQYLVSYHLGLREGTDYRVDTMAPPGGTVCGWRGCVSGFGWGMYGAPTDIRADTYLEGTMILDLTDRATDRLAWRATSQRRVDEGDGSQERITATVVDMVRELP